MTDPTTAPPLSHRSLSVQLLDGEIVMRIGVGQLVELAGDFDVGDPLQFGQAVVLHLLTGHFGQPTLVEQAIDDAIDRQLSRLTMQRAKATPPTPAEAG